MKIKEVPLKKVIIICYVFALWIEAAIPDTGNTHLLSLPPGTNNFLHIPAYFVLSFLIMDVWYIFNIRSKATVCFVATISVGLVAEIIQLITPGRFASVSDVGLNIIGVILGIACFKLYPHRKPAKF